MNIKLTTLCKAIFLTLNLGFAEAFANPTGGEVVSGNASISNQPNNTLQIDQSSNKAIINWKTFDVAQNETVNFHTPSASAITLNRVTSGNASDIEGHINSNGQVWLINQNGMMFGKNAQVNVAGLVASSMNITDENFNKGNYTFKQSGDNLAKVINQGHIHADDSGYVAMLAPQIGNSGIIEAKRGTVAMGAGTAATVSFSGNNLLNIAVPEGTAMPIYDEAGNPVAALSNSGTITADGGNVLMTAESVNTLLDQSINITGIIKADTVNEVNGKIVLTSSHQTILDNATISTQGLNTGDKGGKVEVIGKDVGLFNNTNINASGAAGGGEIRVGRDDTDANAFEADATVIANNVILNANATQSGDGGFIETSGNYLNEQSSHINTLGAGDGKSGTLLLDPWNVTIAATGETVIISPFDATTTSTITASSIATLLAGGNVLINTGTTGTQNGDITVTSAINWSSANTLSLQAAGDIAVNAAINGNTTGNLILTAGGAITQTAALTAGGASFTSGTGAITLVSDNSINGIVTLNSTHGASMKETSGGATITGNITGDLGLTFTNNGRASGLVVSGTTTVSAPEKTLYFANSGNDFGTISVAAQDVSISDINNLILGTSRVTGNLNILTSDHDTINGNVTQSGALDVTGTTTLAAGTGNITLNNANNMFTDAVTVSSAGTVDLDTAAGIIIGGITSSKEVNVIVNNLINNTGSLIVNGAIDTTSGGLTPANIILHNDSTGAAATSISANISAGAGTISIINAGDIDSSITLNSGAHLTSTAASSNAISVGTLLGSLNIASGASITDTTTGSSVSLNGGSGITSTGTFDVKATNLESILDSVSLSQTGGNYGTISTTDAGIFGGLSITETDSTPIVLGAITANTLNVTTSNGAISGSGILTITGASTINSGTNDISLTGANQISGLLTLSGHDINIGNINALELGNVTATGTFDATLFGDVTQAAGTALNITGATNINGESNDVTLANANNNFHNQTVTLTGKDVQINDANTTGLVLGNIFSSGTFTATSAGAITQTDTSIITTQQRASLTATGDISLKNSSNELSNFILNTSGNATLANSIDSTFFTGDIGGDLTLNFEGNILAGTHIAVAGNTTISDAGYDVSLTIPNSFNTINLTAHNAFISNDQALTVGTSTLTGNLILLSQGDLTQTGALNVAGTTELASGSTADINLTNADNVFTGSVSVLAADNVLLKTTGTISTDTITADGNVTLVADQLTNIGSATAITTPGTWNIYLANLDGNTFDSLASGNQAIWGTSYGDTLPSSATGNRYIFGTAKNLTLTPEATPFAISKTVGNVATLPTPTVGTNYEVSGFVNASDYDNAFTQDTIDNNAFVSNLLFASSGAAASATAGTYAVTLSGTTDSTTVTGYTIGFDNTATFGELTVTSTPIPPAPPTPAETSISAATNPAIVGAEITTEDDLDRASTINKTGRETKNPALKNLLDNKNCSEDNSNTQCNSNE